MKARIFTLLYIFVLLISTSKILAVPATPYPITIRQADGTELTIRIKGDEFFKYKTTLDGYLLTPGDAGVLNYAETDSKGNIINTRIKAVDIEKRTASQRQFVLKLNKDFNFSRQKKMQRMKRSVSTESLSVPQKSYPLTGAPKSLVILVNFKDVAFVTPNPQQAFSNMLNQPGYSANGGTGSARDYFSDNSMGKFSPQFDVVGPYTLPQAMSYYGRNDSTDNDNDVNPQQMIIDACALAAASGVNFTQYDTDNDRYVDNVFVYYAGYNEAEGGPENSVWPHRWSLNNSNTRFNEKIIFDYACSSELRGRSGSNMSGIGTFVHEFGHVLGLLDYYPTDESTHHTLSNWSVMDAGPYLNNGRTPPAYSAYDRFFLGWLKPVELKVAGDYILDTLTTSNQAYIITQNGNHNLNGANPSPVEFFTLENRQKKGWDTYLPGRGMLVTRIYYNSTTWANNEPNNNQSAMGVDLIEADGIANNSTLAADPFPGTKNVNFYIPKLRSGVELINKPLSLITEVNGKISFRYITQTDVPVNPAVALDATDLTTGSFVANWTRSSGATGYYLTVYNITPGESQLRQGFDQGGAVPNGWVVTAPNRSASQTYSGISAPSVQFSNTGEVIVTEEYVLPVTRLTFYIRSLGGVNGAVTVEGRNDANWVKLDSVLINNQLNTTKSYSFNTAQNYLQFRLRYTKGSGDVVIDDITAHFAAKLEFNAHEEWKTATSDTLMNLAPDREYFYKVRAAKKLLNPDGSVLYETISEFSNLVNVKTLENTTGNIFRRSLDGVIQVLLPTTDLVIRVYNTIGQQLRVIVPGSNIIDIYDLPKGQVYIISAGQYKTKIIL